MSHFSNIDAISKEVIDSLVTEGYEERRTLEYKLQLPSNSDGDKKEFLADVSSFANAAGGFLFFGIKDKKDSNGQNTGIAESADGLNITNSSQEIARLEQIWLSSIEPRIEGINIRAIEGFANGPIIVIQIPKSWSYPHLVNFKGSTKFYTRGGAGKYPMDLHEIRTAFLQSHSIRDKISEYHHGRISKIVAGETPIPLDGSSITIIHLIPFSAMMEPRFVEIDQLKTQVVVATPISASGYDSRINFDGIVNFFGNHNHDEQVSYVQLGRSGIIEAADTYWLGREDKRIASLAFEERLIETVTKYIQTLKNLGFVPPAALAMTLVMVKGFKLNVQQELMWNLDDIRNSIERSDLKFPILSIDNFNTDVDVLLKPHLDALWNAAGFEKSYNFNNEGRWAPRR